MQLKVIAMIPARYAASRFPGKLMQDLGGKTVIRRTFEATLNTELFHAVYVVTDSPIIYDEITKHGGRALMSKKEHDCGSDRIAEAVESLEVDIVVNVQGDEPFTERDSLKKVLQVFYEEDADQIDLASLMTPMDDLDDIKNPNSVKVIVDKDSYALYFSRSPIPYARDASVSHPYYKHKGVYAFRKQALLDFYRLPMRSMEASEKIECIRYLEYGKRIKMVKTNQQGIEIDIPDDLNRARKRLISEQTPPPIKPVALPAQSAHAISRPPMLFKNFPMVPRVIFGVGSYQQLNSIIEPHRRGEAPFVYLIDAVFEHSAMRVVTKILLEQHDVILYISTAEEPKTSQVDALVQQIQQEHAFRPSGIIGIGGGSIMDLAKAVSIMLTNPGSASQYQGWDLVKEPAIYHVGIPTLSGTGAEVSRTTVLTGPERKLGINSDYTPFDQVILDPELIQDIPKEQWFYTGMDCFIHCVESLSGTYLNAFSQSYGEKAMDLCHEVFLQGGLDPANSNAKLMMASWHGGMSIAYSQVGVAHAMSYGLSYVLGTKHGIGNCIVFDKLGDYYPEGVATFKKMKKLHGIELPKNICHNLKKEHLETMASVALDLEPLWENALGIQWKSKMNKDVLIDLYQQL